MVKVMSKSECVWGGGTLGAFWGGLIGGFSGAYEEATSFWLCVALGAVAGIITLWKRNGH